MNKKAKSPEVERFLLLLAHLHETPESLAEKLGLCARAIQRSIWNDRPLSGPLLRALAEVYEVNVDWLLTGRGEMSFDGPLPAKSTEDGYLIGYLDAEKYEVDLTDAGDVWLVSARAIEGALVKSGAVPGVDYSRLDLFVLAQPFVLQRDKEGLCGLVAKAQSV